MAKADRAAAEQTLSTQASELAALQTQLSSAKAAYETTMSQLTTLRSRVATQTAEIQKKKEELITAESDLSALLIEKSEVEGALLRDKEEARGLHRKMVEMGQQVEGLKTEIEKSRKEAKQQKGLLAIARKQLSTKEAEKAKMMHELGEANGELAAVTREKEETEAELAKETPIATLSDRPDVFRSESLMSAAAHSLPGSHGTTTPVRSDSPAQGKSNNPFERLTKSSTTPTPRSQSPFMPFADAFTPKDAHAVNGVPDSAAATMPQDPFGFAQALAVVEPAILETGPDVFGQMPRPAMAATSPPPKDSLPASGSDTSADDSFITTASTPPPREPVSRSTIENEIASRFPDLGGEAVQFPALVSRRASEGLDHSNDHAETDIMARLQDLDVNDSDSDSDDDKPLANLKSEMTQPDARPLAPNGEPSSAFDDAFELTPRVTTPDIPKPAAPAAQPVVPPAEPKDAFSVAFGIPPGTFSSGAPELQLSSNPPPAPAAPTVVDGVDAFDEALGKISASGSTLPQLTFDAFDDNFDFTSVSEMTMSPSPSLPPLSAAAVNGKAADDAFVMVPSANGGIGDGPSSGRLKKPAFEDVFGPMAPYIPPVAGKSPTTTQNAPTISFDAAATERPPSQLSKPMGSSSASAIVSPQAEASSQSAASPKSENFSMQKATGQMSPSSTRTTSPPPSGSPKTSRESRPSTSSSSKNDHLHPEPKSKEPRHHKLSVSFRV
jgi:epidermal growth factor receptor substrate 15